MLRSAIKRTITGWWAAFDRNSFVYNACLKASVGLPSIPVRPVECYGQCGEDLIVAPMLEAIAFETRADFKDLRYLEIGGNHPFATSTTYLLHKMLGMRGIIVEANPTLVADLKKGRPADIVVNCAIHAEDSETATLSLSAKNEVSSLDQNTTKRWHDIMGPSVGAIKVPAMRINQLIDSYLDGAAPAFMSIDVEGLDLALLRDLDFRRYRPWLIQVEYLDNILPPGNAKEIITHMQQVDYVLVAKTYVNLIFAEVTLLTKDQNIVRKAASIF
jgi:FkbM family methyltransferase